jgi:hypothetical protein
MCERCLEEDESATHILCSSEAIAYLRFCHLGHYFMEPGDYALHQKCRIDKGIGNSIDLEGRSARAFESWPTPYIHTYSLFLYLYKSRTSQEVFSVWKWLWLAASPSFFAPRKRSASIRWIEGWVGPRTSLDNLKKRKLLTLPGFELLPLGCPAHGHSLYLPRLLTHTV